GPNLRYLSGLAMGLSERVTLALFPRERAPALLLPALEVPRARSQVRGDVELFPWSDEEGPARAVARLGEYVHLSGERIGVEERHMRLLEWRALQEAFPGSTVESADALLSSLRLVKAPEEIACMRRAADLLEQGLHDVLARLRPGLTEREVAHAWQWAVAEAGADPFQEEPIVVAGPRGASPHAAPSDRPIQRGELITLDWAISVDGYFADITRTVALGRPAEELKRLYDLVFQANAAGRDAVRPGLAAQDVDRAARSVIAEAGYGREFLHRTGHGLGLEVHEPPYIVEGNTQPLLPGMTFTVEPGIYVEGLGGVRIEDDILVTSAAGLCLTQFPRELLVL
ncbi:MAG: M24 family metallopeptidase, partial [Chloroflexia bacterium]